jgi:hypothetical protein
MYIDYIIDLFLMNKNFEYSVYLKRYEDIHFLILKLFMVILCVKRGRYHVTESDESTQR